MALNAFPKRPVLVLKITWMSLMIFGIIHMVKGLSKSSNDYYFMQ